MNNHHQNARTTFHSRALIMQRVLKKGKSVREVPGGLGVSQRTVYKWLTRYRAGGQDALYNRSSRSRRSPRRLPVGRVATIAAMRRMRMSCLQIFFSLSTPLSSVTLELRRLGLNRLPRLEPKPPVIRYKYKAPSEMIHLDVKKLDKWATASMATAPGGGAGRAGNITLQVGQRPIMVVGNSGGDPAMLQYTASGPAYDRKSHMARQNEWTLINMKNDFAQAFPTAVK